jgi:hypothetical protein
MDSRRIFKAIFKARISRAMERTSARPPGPGASRPGRLATEAWGRLNSDKEAMEGSNSILT